jgi:hypothetical protein
MPIRVALTEKESGHHAFIFVAEQMTVEYGHSADDGSGEVHDRINAAAVWTLIVSSHSGVRKATPLTA